MTKYVPLALFVLVISIGLNSCCDPKPLNSEPFVIDSTFRDTAIKDVYDRSQGADLTDSGYYPIYAIDIKNVGTEADTFTLTYERSRDGFIIPLVVKQFLLPNETKTFQTEGPIPDHGVPATSYFVYYSFFVKQSDSTDIHLLKPRITIQYGNSERDVESCGSPGFDKEIDYSAW